MCEICQQALAAATEIALAFKAQDLTLMQALAAFSTHAVTVNLGNGAMEYYSNVAYDATKVAYNATTEEMLAAVLQLSQHLSDVAVATARRN